MMKQNDNENETIKKESLSAKIALRNNPKIELVIKPVAWILLSILALVILICIFLLVQNILSANTIYESLIFETSNIKLGLQSLVSGSKLQYFNYLCFRTTGYSLLMIMILISIITQLQLKKIRYALFTIAIIFLFYSFFILIITSSLTLKWWQYFTEICLIFSTIYLTLSYLITKSDISYKNKIIGILLLIVAIVSFY